MKKFLPAFFGILSVFICWIVAPEHDISGEAETEGNSIENFFQYQLEKRAAPDGIIHPEDVNRVEEQIMRLQYATAKTNAKNLVWNELGPDDVGGRTLALLPDKDHPGWIYAGAASGGLWLSKTNGTSWYHVENNSDFYENLCISSIVQTPDGDIYFSTGEGSFQGLRGGGIWRKSKDSTSFRRLTETIPFTSSSFWKNVNFMAASSKRDRIFAGNENGLYISDDDGQNWVIANGAATGNCTEVKAEADGTIMALINKKIYISSNDGDAFTLSSSGLPNVGNIGRGSIAIAPGNTNVMYAIFARYQVNDCYGAYRSTNKGVSWQSIGMGNPYFNPFGDQGWYDICLTVAPDNPDHLYIGGIGIWEWSGPGNNFIETVNPYNVRQGAPYVHPDIHTITMDTRTNPYTIWVGCDGGIYRSTDKGKVYAEMNKLYITTQFYSMGASRTGNVVGGTQDNNSIYINKMGNTPKAGFTVLGGDGFFSEISQHDPYEIKFVESQYGNLRRNKANSGMTSFYDAYTTDYIITQKNGPFSSPFTLWEHPQLDTFNHFAIGVFGAVFMTNQSTNFSILGGPRWFRMASFSANAAPGCMEFSADGNTLYFGIGASLYRVSGINTANYDSTFNDNPAAHGITVETLPIITSGGNIEGIACDLRNNDRLLVVTGTFGVNDHVFICSNARAPQASVKFTSVQGNLPAFPCYDAAIDYTDTNTFLVGTEYGMYASFDAGKTWSEQNTGMARVAVYQIKQNIDQRQPWTGSKYYLATFGRGMFESTSLTTGINAASKSSVGSDLKVFPNPATQFLNLNTNENGEVRVYDMKGLCVLKTVYTSGDRVDVGALVTGTYILEFERGGSIQRTRFIKAGH